VELFELVPAEGMLDAGQQQSLLYSSDLELGETTRAVLERIEALRPARVVFDGLAEIRLLAQGALRYRRQVLALKHYFVRHGATVLLLDDMSAPEHDLQLHSVAHGVLRLEQLTPAYGPERRRLSVTKYRGAQYRGGYHDFTIATGGLRVFPRLIAAERRRPSGGEAMSSGIPGLDALVGGGLELGTSTLVTGPAGSGKSLLALHYAVCAAKRGQKAVAYPVRRGRRAADRAGGGPGPGARRPPRGRAPRLPAGRRRRALARRVRPRGGRPRRARGRAPRGGSTA
jgi:circadian clock protein KaiC